MILRGWMHLRFGAVKALPDYYESVYGKNKLSGKNCQRQVNRAHRWRTKTTQCIGHVLSYGGLMMEMHWEGKIYWKLHSRKTKKHFCENIPGWFRVGSNEEAKSTDHDRLNWKYSCRGKLITRMIHYGRGRGCTFANKTKDVRKSKIIIDSPL